MSIIFSTDKCCFIDHERFLNGIYSSCKVLGHGSKAETVCTSVPPAKTKLKFDANAFAIHLPFLMDSQVHKYIGGTSPDALASDKPLKSKKKRKRQHVNPIDEYHEQIKDVLISALQELKEIGCRMKLFFPPSLELMATNNRDARNVNKRVQKLSEKLAEIVDRDNSHTFKMTVASFDDSAKVDKLNWESLVNYTGEESCIVSFTKTNFVLPAKSCFFMSQLEHLPQLVKLGKTYDLIVLDPPWFNKSVKRKKGYSILCKDDILEIPIERLSKQGCIVALWVTNSQSLLEFVQRELFPAWKIKFCAIWHWVKVTKSAELICDLDSHHKKPYEHVIIGQNYEASTKIDFQNHRVIFSVPSSIHSHKPPLHDLFQPYVKANSENLELFARYLLPGWTSWGNEVLLLQHVDNYECEDLL